MAGYQAIASAGQAILSLLVAAYPKDEFGIVDFALYQANDFRNPMAEGISLYLYRVTPNTSLRGLPARLGPDGRRYRPSLPVDLHYMLTAWAKTAAKQHLMLGWAMRTLEDTPILPPALLNLYGGSAVPVFAPSETLELILEVLSIQDLYNIWQVAGANQQVSVPYTARMILLDSLIVEEGKAVQTRVLDYGKAP